MPEIPPKDIIATRQDHVGRFAVFHQPGPNIVAPLPWQAIALDIGNDDTITIQVRLDERHEPGAPAWTARDLLRVALGRQLTEGDRSGDALARTSASHLASALVALQRRLGLPPAPSIAVAPGPHRSVYAWTVATLPGVGSLQLCPGFRGDGEGVTPELLLHVLDQLLADAANGIRSDLHLREAAQRVGDALAAEVARMRAVCGPAQPH
ncbi:conserved protein of unknown function [Rhodovastum atsumiense]|uniref:Uncharacterized protein n=1 Tax=Rhodovastum atsumiense TaxID=504468 RepID=A0A5M6IQI8_9PROT|nr:hypothetical protein [Rhodovastum atsumiense]KAA5609828.1 hypothetical protein F1189_22320 [Rhodovastum atsumiense]CAH2603735.1 conserved protein of unknown function [Rhodovastum atsumiense]